MKVIDLLNKIANGEEVPKKVKVTTGTLDDIYRTWVWLDCWYAYELDDCEVDICTNKLDLNDKVEILEEEKKIPEKIDMFDYFTGYDFSGTDEDLLKHLETNFETINKSINEIIGYLQYIKNKGDE